MKIRVRRITTLVSALALVMNVFLPSAFLIEILLLEIPVAQAADGNMCQVAVDVVLVMDTSGSMAEGENPSRCEWQNLELVGPSYQCVSHTDYNQTEAWCQTKKVPQCGLPVYTPATPKKIKAAKDAAKSFIDNLGPNDQSAIGFFNSTAHLEKALSHDHAATKATIDGLVPSGSTNIGDAIGMGNTELDSVRANPQAVKAMILLTDGKANEPNKSVTGKDPEEYALSKAQEAADSGYKIFTIGLGSGSEINETMLQQIAITTGAKYYHAPDGNGLSEIYQQIAFEVCQYGSISGCKWNDINNNGKWESTETGLLENWEIALSGDASATQLTDEWGCYKFSGLEPGSYQVAEVEQEGWVQTYPVSPNLHNVKLTDWNQHLTDFHFGNYQPLCGNQIVDGSFGEVCEIGDTEEKINEQTGYQEIRTCNQDCLGWSDWTSQESCGDGAINGNEQCDGTEGVPDEHWTCNQCNLEYIPWCGDNIKNDAEECDGEAPQSCTTNSGYDGTSICNQCSWSTCETSQFCGDSIINGPEICDGGSQACTINGYNGTQNCNQGCDGWQTCQPTEFCGDGTVNGNEQCDDGNLVNGDGCSNQCTTEQVSPPVCGNGIPESGEVCDDGQNNGTYGYCNSDCTGQTPAICGNGVKEGSEQCDDASQNGEHKICSAQCTSNAACNDGQDNDGDGLNDQNDPGCHTDGDVNNSQSYDKNDSNETDMTPGGINFGDMVINEIMQNPKKVPDGSGEWFEIYNTTNHNIDLSGCVMADSGSNYHTIISNSLVALPHSYVVLGNNSNQAINGGADVDYQYSNFVLANSSDEIFLACNGVEIDRVEYDGGPNFPDPDGASMILASPYLDNNIGSNWCLSSSPFGLGDKGTPGTVNDSCGLCTSSVSGKKYESQGGANQPLANWTIELYDNQNNLLTATSTDAAGNYSFSNLCLGNYKIKEVLQNGWARISPTENSGVYLVSISNEDTHLTDRDFINAQYGSISGCKFEDLDGATSTVLDLVGKPNWTINLFNSTSTSTPLRSTTTDAFGFYHFNNLLPDTYTLDELLQTNWIQLSGPTSSLVILSGTHSANNNFVNYYTGGQDGPTTYCGDGIKQSPNESLLGGPENNGYEACDGTNGLTVGYHCTDQCILAQDSGSPSASSGSSSGGAGPFTQLPEAGLTLTYQTQKTVGQNYSESIVVSNQGNIVLTYGVLTLDLPEDKLNLMGSDPVWYSYDPVTKIVTWQIPALMVGQSLTFEFEVKALAAGEATSSVLAVFKEAAKTGSLNETISQSALGPEELGGVGGPEEETAAAGAGAETELIAPGAGAEGQVGAEVAGEKVGEETLEPKQEVAGLSDEQEGQVGSPSKGWYWLIIILLLGLLILGYHFVLKEDSVNDVPLNQ